MSRTLFLSLSLACAAASPAVHADPIHAITGGAYWHHESGWEFPEKAGEFERVGIPQDVAGSKDAVAHYACIVDGTRIVASVDVYPADSTAAQDLEADRASRLASEKPFAVGKTQPLSGTRVLNKGAENVVTALYFISAGEWRVRIRIADANPAITPMLDAFVRDQRWDALSAVQTPR